MTDLTLALIFAALLIGGALLYRRKKGGDWPEMIYRRLPHWPANQYGENGGGKAYVDPAYEHAWAAMCQEVYEATSSERDRYQRNMQGFEVELQAILHDRPAFDADQRRGTIARWVVSPASPYPAGSRTEADVLRDMKAFSAKAAKWVRENASKVERP